MIQSVRNLPYEDRLMHLNLHSVERRRLRGDEVFKWMTGFVNKVLVVKEPGRTRRNNFKLLKLEFNKKHRKQLFTNGMVDE